MRTPVVALELEQGIEEGVAAVTSFVPELLGFLALLVGGTLAARLLARLAGEALGRVGFDRVVARSQPGRALRASPLAPSEVVAKATFAVLVLVVLRLAFAVFGSNPIGDLLASVFAYLPNAFVALVVVVLAVALAAAVRDVVAASLRETGAGGAAGAVAGGLVLAAGASAALSQLRVAPRVVEGLYHALLALVVGSGIIAIGVGGIPPMRAQWEKALRALGQGDEKAPPAARPRRPGPPRGSSATPDERGAPAPTLEGRAPHRDRG